jgi:sigma-B regulation protein RsbU (phosphoserine phosphatase)
MDETKVLEPVYESIYDTILHFLVEFTIIFVVIVFVSSRLAVPIKRLAKFAQQLAAGDLDAHAGDIRFAKEIDQLAHTFDKMVVDLKSNIAQRIKEEAVRQMVEGELKAARRIQASLLPRIFPPFPEQKEFDLHAMNEPVAFIAGDFFDFFFIKPDTLAFVIADVSGHGIPAALFMAVSRTIMRTFSTPERSPREVIDHVNRVLNTDNDDMMFVTLFYGHYNIETGDLTYVNAGHNPPYIVSKDGRLETLSATGSLVATFEDISYDEQTVRLEPGDLLVTYTDGVTEAHSSKDHNLYGEDRLEQLLYEIRHESVEAICERIHRDADQFAEHECQDDVTILVLRRNETTSA